MAKIDELQQLASDLQSQVDVLQDKVAAKIAADNQTIADLEAVIAAGNGVTDAQLQTVIDSITASRDDLAATPTA